MKKIARFAALSLLLGSTLIVSGCSKENKYTRVSLYKNADGMNLYLTGNAQGYFGSTYVSFNDYYDPVEYAKNIEEQMSGKYPNMDIAYFPYQNNVDPTSEGLKYFLNTSSVKDNVTIVYVDSFRQDGDNYYATGVWVARNGWHNTKSTAKNFITGLVKANKYRYDHQDYKISSGTYKDKSFTTFGDMYDFMKEKQKELPEYNFTNYTSVYEYTTILALQNKDYFKDRDKFVVSQSDNGGKPFIDNGTATEIFGKLETLSSENPTPMPQKGLDLEKDIKDTLGLEKNDKISFDKMRYGIYQADLPETPKKIDYKQVILWSVVGGVVLIGVIVLLIVRRVKTGKKLFDIKKALDSDIDPEDPKIINMRKVGADLKKIREDKGMPLKDAAVAMNFSPRYLENVLEAGEIVLSKRQRRKFIDCYRLPEDYFDKAYKIND